MPNTTWLAGQRITASALNDMFPASTTVQLGTGQNITSHASNYVTINFDTVVSSTDSDMWSVSNPSRLVAPTAGTYIVHGGISWPGTLSSADGRAEFRVNGTMINTAKATTMRGSSGNCSSAFSGTVVFTDDGQYVEVYVNQNSGSTTSIGCTLGLTRVSYATS